MQIPERNYKKYAILCGCLLVGGILFAYVIFPPILKAILRSVSVWHRQNRTAYSHK